MALTSKQTKTFLIPLFCIFSILGIYAVWLLLFVNNTYTHITKLTPQPSECPHVPIGSTILGFKSLDDFILGVECMWGIMIDGSDPGLSLFAFMFTGIFLGACTVCWTDGLERYGNLRRATIWPLAFNFVGFGPSMPIFCLLDILAPSQVNPTSSMVDATDPKVLRQWNVLPLSITSGFIIPSFLMVNTSFSPETHRNLALVWATFPILVLVSQEIFVAIATLLARKGYDDKKINYKETWLNHQFTYLFSIRMSALCHFSGLAIMTICWLFPGLFRDEVVGSLAWSRLIKLPGLAGGKQVEDLGEGMLGLLQWDGFIGGLSGVVWALWKLANAREEKGLKEGSWIADTWRTSIICTFLSLGCGTMSPKMDSDEIYLEQKVDIGKWKEGKKD